MGKEKVEKEISRKEEANDFERILKFNKIILK